MKLSVIVSVYNEAQVLPQFQTELQAALASLDCESEVLFVDDGSGDGSRELVDRIAQEWTCARAIHFAKNFGHEAAMIAGIDHASGDALVCIDADCQNPPSLLGKMLALYGEGNDIVTMVREDRADGGPLKSVSSRLFYSIINHLSDTKLQSNASDFFLISNRVADVLRKDYRERTRFLRGIIQTVGFRSIPLAYHAPARAAGKSKYSLSKLTHFAFHSIASFSKAPLKLGIYSGLLFGLISVALIIYSIVMWIIEQPVGGYTTLIIFLSAFAAISLIMIGIIGYYIGFIFDEVKGRPLYTIDYMTEKREPLQ